MPSVRIKRKQKEEKDKEWAAVMEVVSGIFGKAIMTIIGAATVILAVIVLRVQNRQLSEMEKRAFLTLPINDISDSPNWDYSHSIFKEEREIHKSNTFGFAVVNSGPKPSKGGSILFKVPRYLNVDTIDIFGGLDVGRRRDVEVLENEGTTIYQIDFVPIESGGNTQVKGSMLGAVGTITVSMPDTATPEIVQVNGQKYKAWVFNYRIVAKDEDGFYPERQCWIYFGIEDQGVKDSLRDCNQKQNVYDERFRP